MFEGNRQFETFRAALADRGVTLRYLWTANRGMGSKRDDVALVAFTGNGFSPRIGTAVVIDYGVRDGFALMTDFAMGGTIQEDAAFIATARDAPVARDCDVIVNALHTAAAKYRECAKEVGAANFGPATESLVAQFNRQVADCEAVLARMEG